MSEDWELAEVLDLLSDEYARSILAATSVEPMSAKQLAEQCDASLPTIYRRVERLQEYDLLEERTRVDLTGSHHKMYSATLSEFSMDLEDGGYEGTIERVSRADFPGEDETDTADRFTEMWENL
ncbi:ArsR/SmtB family transcription factor [Halorientalis litorea]|uniref:ArsR/SmtB family transcription factor n=1 Tax=Halorientalis litorea TaxID=2931977 RepID=UPI001FF3D34F|nr:helix-turn-helix domain-containing protein [Halorientalis litorea]